MFVKPQPQGNDCMTWQSLVCDDPVMQLSLLFFVVLFLLAVLPHGGRGHVGQGSCRALVGGEGICKLESDGYDGLGRTRRWFNGQSRAQESSAFPELESSWSAQCTEWFCQAIQRIRKS
jgi:hypothetical protein